MKKFSEYLTAGLLNESSWSRIIQHIEGDDDFAVISAYRTENTDKQDLAAHVKLKEVVRSLNLGYIEQDSGYTYKDKETGESEIRKERSLFIPNIDYKTAMDIGKQFDQESILFKSKDKGFVLVYTKNGEKKDGTKFNAGDVELTFKSKKDNTGKITFNPDVLKYAYSSLIKANKNQKDKPYSFIVESIYEGVMPTRTESLAQRDNYMTWKNIL